MSHPFTPATLRQTAYWASFFAANWRQEFPDRISGGTVALDGTPDWHPDFSRWLSRTDEAGPEERLRTTKVMARLHRTAPRVYDVLYRMLIQGDTVPAVTRWLNERAARNGIPLRPGRDVHYTEDDTVAIIVAGIEYAREYW